VTTALATKQDSLVSGTNIKTINSTSVLGSGDIAVQPTLVSGTSIKTVNSNSLLGSGDVAVQETLVSGTNIKTLNNTSLLGSGNITLTANPSGVSGAIQFSTGSAFGSDADNLFWDDTNNRLGVGTNAPTATTHFRGSGSTSATTSLLVQNSTGSSVLTFKDDGTLNLSQGSMYASNGSMYASRAFLTNIDSPFFNTLSFASGTTFPRFGQTTDAGVFLYKGLYNPTSGSGNFDVFYAQPTINQTGGANGITRGLYINPTLTAAADFRAIETTAGKIIFAGLPTSSAGLVSGQLWNDAGTLKIA
jgi:hypothetical protein